MARTKQPAAAQREQTPDSPELQLSEQSEAGDTQSDVQTQSQPAQPPADEQKPARKGKGKGKGKGKSKGKKAAGEDGKKKRVAKKKLHENFS